MRSVLLTLLMLTGSMASADMRQIECGACRDVYQHPTDFGNFAFNLVFGDQPLLTMADGSQVKIWNPAGQWAIVDLNFVLQYEGLSFSIVFLTINLIAPTGTIQIQVQDPKGQMTEYEVFASSSDLIVGEGSLEATTETASPESEDSTLSYSSGGVGSSTGSGGGSYNTSYYWYWSSPDSFITNTNE